MMKLVLSSCVLLSFAVSSHAAPVKKLQILIDNQLIVFDSTPILKNSDWLVPIAPICKQLELKVEYPDGEDMVVICGGGESELCVPLQLEKDAYNIDKVTYAKVENIAEPFGFGIYTNILKLDLRLSDPSSLQRNSRYLILMMFRNDCRIFAERRRSSIYGDRGEGCRGQLPGWQQFYAKHREKFNLVSIAPIDAQGASVVQPWHEKANAEFVTLVDSQNILGNLYDLKAIPYGVMIDEAGRLVKPPFSINVTKKETIVMLEKWLSDPTYNVTLLSSVKPRKHRKTQRLLKRMHAFNSVGPC